MNPESRKSIVIAGAILLVAVVVMAFFDLKWPVGYPRQNIRPTLALELPHDVEEFQAIVHEPRNRVREAQWVDFGFIVVYAFFFFVFAIGIEDDRTATSMGLAMLVTALADVGEDIFILRALAAPVPTPGALRAVLIFGCAKWLGYFTIVLAAAVAMQGDSVWSRAASLLFRLFALLGMYGAIMSFASAAGRPLVSISMAGASLTFLAVVGVYAFGLIWPPAPVRQVTSS